jgi:hypothetical protein
LLKGPGIFNLDHSIMKKTIIVLTFILSLGTAFGQDRVVSGVKFPGHIIAEKDALFLNGAGIREKYFMDMYVCGLYLKNRSTDPNTILNADEKMGLRLVIVSSMVSNSVMQKAVREGFEKSTNNNTAPIKKEIETFITAFSDEIKKGDAFELNYVPGTGCVVTKNGVEKTRIAGLAFKKALFGIWLGSNPAHEELRNDLLGQ